MWARCKCLLALVVRFLASVTATVEGGPRLTEGGPQLIEGGPHVLSNGIGDTEGTDLLTPESFIFWPNGTVPFFINASHFDNEQQVQILTALANFAFKTCLKFMPLVAPPEGSVHVLVLQNPDGVKPCYFIEGGHSREVPHYVTLGYKCLESPNVDMMLMKALGFPFEHNRAIRDLYIDVMTENVEQGHALLFAKDIKLPTALRDLPYDIDSVMHFDERQFSKNGHKTIFIKNPAKKQRRRSLTNLDLRRIEIVYGPECLKRDRAKKLLECLPYDVPYHRGGRRKREASAPPPPADPAPPPPADPVPVPGESLRVNPDITPPPPAASGDLDDELADKLKKLGIEKEIQDIVDKVSKVSSKVLNDARTAICNHTETRAPNASVKAVSLVEVVEMVAAYAESLVNHALKNVTQLCQVPDPVSFYQRAWCTFFDPRCRQTYFKSTALWNTHSTNFRPYIVQSTKYWFGYGKNRYARARNDTDDEPAQEGNVTVDAGKDKVRRKREVSPGSVSPQDTTVASDVFEDVVTPKPRPTSSAPKSRRRARFTGEPKEMYTYRNRQDSDSDGWGEAPRVTAFPLDSDNEAEGSGDSPETVAEPAEPAEHAAQITYKQKSKVKKAALNNAEQEQIRQPTYIKTDRNPADSEETAPEPAKPTKNRNSYRKPTILEPAPRSPEQEEQKRQPIKEKGERAGRVQEIHLKPKKVNRDNNMEKKKVHVPKTVNLSQMNEEFYDARRWRDGVVRYIISEQGDNYDLADMRSRLHEVNQILRQKTCVRIQEITEEQAPRYEDYLVLDTSPDYVTGKVGGRQNFGCIELFAGGQHRQHTAMMVMAMLGFYFEVSRHDRDKYVVVHPRNIRADKLHHFEMLREDATLALPYDYKSATQPSWQFWRKVGKTGIATVATYKELDPDGKIMKQLGQNPELLSEIDIVKINSVYGVNCLGHNRGKTTKYDKSNTFISLRKSGNGNGNVGLV